MNHVHIPDLPWEEIHSPTKKFHSFIRNISLALGGARNTGTWGGGHPFDLQIRRLPPGASVCPFHLHLAQWKMFVVMSGTGTVRTSEARTEVKPGDVFFHPPGAPHQLTNTGSADVEVLIIADNPPMAGGYFPDSNKWNLCPPAKIFRITEADYFDGEDTLPATGAPASSRQRRKCRQGCRRYDEPLVRQKATLAPHGASAQRHAPAKEGGTNQRECPGD